MEYNVVDSGEVKTFLAGCSQNQATARLLGICLERALRKGPDGLQPLTKFDPDAPGWLREKFAAGVRFHRFVPDNALEARVRHVVDWIEAARVNNEEWLQRCDDKGRPLKLLKIGSLAQAEAEADKAMRRFAFNAAAASYADGEGEESVMTFADDSRIVRLLTPAALDRESAMMGHCVGQGAYDAAVADRSRIIYSLRDTKNKAHVTFEVKVEGNELRQCKGKQNGAPVEKYMPQVRAFVEREGLVLTGSPRATSLVQDTEGNVFPVTALPEGLKVGGELCLSATYIRALPEGLSVGGNLDLRLTMITALPERLTVGGNLDLTDTGITALPKDLKVNGHLFLRGTNITSLPEGLCVGSLHVRGAKITALPKGLCVGGNLSLRDTDITVLSDGLRVGGNLDLEGSAVTALPEGLSVGGYLILRGTKVTELPGKLNVGAGILGGPKPPSKSIVATVAPALRPSAWL